MKLRTIVLDVKAVRTCLELRWRDWRTERTELLSLTEDNIYLAFLPFRMFAWSKGQELL